MTISKSVNKFLWRYVYIIVLNFLHAVFDISHLLCVIDRSIYLTEREGFQGTLKEA